MKARVHCPGCAGSFSVPLAAEGKRATCPKCQERFVISFAGSDVPAETGAPFEIHADAPLPAKARKARKAVSTPEKKTLETRKVQLPLWGMIALPSIAALLIGYFSGREHLKYEMRSAMSEVGKAFAEGITAEENGVDESELSDVVGDVKPPEPEPIPRVQIGEAYSTDQFTITLTEATIEKPQVKDVFSETQTGKENQLVLHWQVSNTADRKTLEYRAYRTPVIFKLLDDVENSIRGVSYGMSSRPIGALRSGESIAPGAAGGHVEVFELPLPKTEYLVLTLNLICLGSEGEIEFQIPIESINNRDRIAQ